VGVVIPGDPTYEEFCASLGHAVPELAPAALKAIGSLPVQVVEPDVQLPQRVTVDDPLRAALGLFRLEHLAASGFAC
jgi:hypothetical protein